MVAKPAAAADKETRTSHDVPSRRTFLKRGLFGSAVLLLGGGGLALYPSREVASPGGALRVLEPRSFQVLAAFAARVVTVAGADPGAIARSVDKMLASAPPETHAKMNALLGLFENALPGLLLDGRVQPFTRLSPDAQDRVLESWRRSRLAVRRTGFQALRKLCLAAFYAEETSWAAMGYHPPSGLNAMAYDDSKVGTPEWLEAQSAQKAGGT